MNCKKTASGSWECYAEGPRDPITNKRKTIRKQAKKKVLAQQKVKEALEDLAKGIDRIKAKHITFAEVAEDWMRVYEKSGVKRSTVRSRESSLKNINRYFGDVVVGRITHQMIQDMLLDMYEKGYSKSLLDHAKVTTRFVFQHAKKQKLRMDNPVTETIVPRKRKSVEEIENEKISEKYFEVDELEKFLKAAETHGLLHDQEWFPLLAFTGMRAGELCALKWTDVFFDTNQIRITKTMDNIADMQSYELTPPKSLKAIRIIDVDSQIMAILKRLKAKQNESLLKYRVDNENYHEENFVFSRPKNGYPYSTKFLYKRTRRLCMKAGLSKIEGAHILRHTHITMLTEAKVELDAIMNRVGHEDSKTTKNIYTHITKNKKKDAAERISFHFGELLNYKIEG
ncbi:tyrosine-type recombinase/integrase [Planomicrobium sp. CPCC 101079]|uniref:tyrosine-type recombinase/integrase n=1 Tax=Planomicrobium sp. CPCC 101079 TaxID=2599618 RepID=UPI0011B7B10B|nr:tyrosine-type recombinase/integrase [Planomicrobium sp. CPCC 101079]TWT04641.1 site-specific integrase [Planomicrobium sp. CPCC 101079]